MRVPDEMLRCVAFLYRKTEGNMRPMGTAGWFACPVPGTGNSAGILMTAQHVIDGFRSDSDDAKVHVRVNRKDGGSKFVEFELDEWVQYESNLDVAILPTGTDRLVGDNSLDFSAWQLGSAVARNATMKAEDIGIGDEVFTVGLFHRHTGSDHIEPIVRVGNLAALPSGPIVIGGGRTSPAVLIEARSIGGLSGSPVFVHAGYARWRAGQVMRAGNPMPFFFLGIVHGHWDAAPEDLDAVVDSASGSVNTGIAIVIPAEEIMSRIVDPLMQDVAATRAGG